MAWNSLEYEEDYILRESFIRPRFYDLIHCDYALCGAYVMKEYLPERSTYSFDLYLSYADLARVHASLTPYLLKQAAFADTHRYYVLRRGRIHFNLIALSEGWATEALTAAQQNLDLQTAEPKLPFQWLVLSKMSHGRRQDYMDCARLMARANGAQILATKSLLQKWLPQAIQPLRQLYQVGRRELQYAPSGQKAYQSQSNEPLDWHQIALRYSSYQEVSWEETFAELLHISFPVDWESVTDL